MNEQASDSTAAGEKVRPQGGVRSRLVLALACGVLAWAGWTVWKEAATSVGSQRFRDTLPQLHSAEAAERWRAAGTLQLVNDLTEVEPAVTPLTHALSDRDPEVKIAAARSLGALIAQTKYLPDGTSVPQEVAQKLAAYTKWLGSQDKMTDGHWITTALGRVAPKTPVESEAVALLIRSLELEDRSLLGRAAKAVASFGKSAAPAVPKLRALKENSALAAGAASATLDAIEGPPKPDPSESKTS
jgi:hypothetical protein